MTNEQGPLELSGPELNEDISVRALAAGEGPTRSERVEHPGPMLQSKAMGNDLRCLPTATQGTCQDEVRLQVELAYSDRLLLEPRPPHRAELAFGVGGDAWRTSLSGNSVPHQV